MVYINASGDDRLFKQLNYFSPPIMLLFFVKSGLGFRLDALVDTNSAIAGVPLLVVGVLYFVVRIAGKYAGAFVGCAITKKPKEVRNYLGLALIPQAGVAIGLAALGARLLGGDVGSALQTIILSSSILYELIGPACAKLSLYLSKSYGGGAALYEDNAQAGIVKEEKTEVDILKERLYAIQSEIDCKEYSRSEEELAFNEAVDESEEQFYVSDYVRRKFKNRR